MNWAFDMGRICGIRLRIHYLFVFFVGALVLHEGIKDAERNTFYAPVLLLLLLFLFGFVLLHELGHSLMARRFGIPTKDITLWPLGGIARLGQIPDNPTVELAIAVAGPAVNIVIAIILLPFILMDVQDFWSEAFRFPTTSILSFCFVVNLFMAGFNFIPAFPMDGGRVLRSLLGYRMSFLDATRKAVRVGRYFAIAFIIYGLIRVVPMLVLIGVFILIVGTQEERAVRWRSFFEGLQGTPLKEVFDEDGRPVYTGSDDELRAAMARGDFQALHALLASRMAGRGQPPPTSPGAPTSATPIDVEVVQHDPPDDGETPPATPDDESRG